MTTDVVPFDYAAEIERSADPGEYVVQTLERAKGWLVEALSNGDIDTIVELKSQAEAIRIYSMSKQLGHDAEVAASEIVRRAERGIAGAVRKGQDAAEIKSPADGGRPAQNASPMGEAFPKRSPSEFFASKKEMADSYAMTDGVSDEQFEEALTEAKAEGNLSRANVVRKAKQVAKPEAVTPAKPKKPNRRPLNDAIREAAFSALRMAETVSRIQADDRWKEAAPKIDPLTRENLRRAIELLTAFADGIPTIATGEQ